MSFVEKYDTKQAFRTIDYLVLAKILGNEKNMLPENQQCNGSCEVIIILLEVYCVYFPT